MNKYRPLTSRNENPSEKVWGCVLTTENENNEKEMKQSYLGLPVHTQLNGRYSVARRNRKELTSLERKNTIGVL